ncbi:uncharacterized protein [Ptychodera flava]|uniref:uncharacterized protein n=1 Tax=Ptychodera flava TaxID=63121 RepID=UPI00396A1421
MAGLPNPLTSTNNQPHLRLQYTLRGIQRLQGPSSRPRLPITFDILRQLCSLLRSTVYGPYLDLLLESAFVLAFFGFLRCSEFTCSGRSFNPAYNLCVRDLNVQTDTQGYPDALSVNIKASKTDQMRRGFKLRLFATKSTICPVTTIHRFLRVRRQMCSSPQEPLFILPERVPLNRETFTALLRSLLSRLGFQPHLYAGHSFRIGAATTAAHAHLPDHLIQTLGRWSSDCYRTYIRTPESLLRHASQSMTMP